ncbi:MAG: hypothetical protein ACM3JP_02960 [Betaproteobacteria bacterium]
MFGYPTLVTGGNMFMGLHQDAHLWIDRSFAYARHLPTKTAKTPKKK